MLTIEPDTVSKEFQAFRVGSLGNFPYYWQNPTNLKFNEKTYHWISAGLKANTFPIQQSQPFTNLYISALSKVNYSLSNSDQTKLNQTQQNIIRQQGAVLEAWQSAFGTIPAQTEDLEPIDIIIYKIIQTWASPPITLEQLQTSHDINGILNKVPMSGKSILPILVNYLNALQSSVTLINATTMSRGYLQQALAAVQNPITSNGAMETSDGLIKPAYRVSTPLKNILESLNSTDKSRIVTLKMSVARASQNEYSVEMNGGMIETIPMADYLSIDMDDGVDLFQSMLAADSDSAKVDATFNGVTTVHFGPANFSKAIPLNWYWISPIKDALKNGEKDISGFKFSPCPQIDFSKTGPFAFLTGVVISKRVSLKITSKCINYKTIARNIKALGNVHLNFLGMPMGTVIDGTSKHQATASTNDSDSSVSIHFEPPLEVTGDSIESTAFVLGVQTEYPTST
ncbi:MAG: hypothetical protein ABW170_12145 [Candidatus Thiodiazotropha sp. L084R]